VYPAILPQNKAEEPTVKAGDGSTDTNPNIEAFVNDMLAAAPVAYEQSGTIDLSTRTRADDEAARRQTAGDFEKTQHKKKKAKATASPEKKTKAGKKDGPKKKYIYSINPRTKSRTRLSEVKEFNVKGVNTGYLRKFKKWERVAYQVYSQLSFILPTIEEEHDFSAVEGEVNIERLIEILSDKGPTCEMPGLFDIFQETRRSLDVIIGIDASGSTAQSINTPGEDADTRDIDTILDVEKAFAMIFGRAMSFLTEQVRVYAFNSVTSTNIYKAETIDAVTSFEPDAANRDGDFIRYVNDLLQRSDAEVKYFFLLSDGQPSADNYNGKDALGDTLIAMRETVNAGIKLIYFNFDSIRREYYNHFKREATYAQYFTSPDEILTVIPDLVTTVSNSIK
jgi:nitric oxide reductase activation protein